MKSAFWLEKYYFDMIDDRGECWIAYDAYLRLWGLPISYVEVSGTGQKPASSLGFRHASRYFRDGAFRYVDRKHGVDARWEGGEVEPRKFRYDNDLLSWELVQLRSRVTISRNSQSRIGFGYGECVTIKVPPWKLGISKLSWGRYLSPTAFLTWIVADGIRPIRYGIFNGEASGEVGIGETSVTVGDITLRFTCELSTVFQGDVFRDWLPGAVRLLGIVLRGKRPTLRQSKSVYGCELGGRAGVRERGSGVAETVWLENT